MEGSRKGGINWCSKILEWIGKKIIGAGQATVDRCKWRKNVAESSKALHDLITGHGTEEEFFAVLQ